MQLVIARFHHTCSFHHGRRKTAPEVRIEPPVTDRKRAKKKIHSSILEKYTQIKTSLLHARNAKCYRRFKRTKTQQNDSCSLALAHALILQNRFFLPFFHKDSLDEFSTLLTPWFSPTHPSQHVSFQPMHAPPHTHTSTAYYALFFSLERFSECENPLPSRKETPPQSSVCVCVHARTCMCADWITPGWL